MGKRSGWGSDWATLDVFHSIVTLATNSFLFLACEVQLLLSLASSSVFEFVSDTFYEVLFDWLSSPRKIKSHNYGL